MKILRLPALMLIAIFATVSVSEAAQKIGYIDSETLREKLPEFRDIQRQLERLQQQYNKKPWIGRANFSNFRKIFENKSCL